MGYFPDSPNRGSRGKLFTFFLPILQMQRCLSCVPMRRLNPQALFTTAASAQPLTGPGNNTSTTITVPQLPSTGFQKQREKAHLPCSMGGRVHLKNSYSIAMSATTQSRSVGQLPWRKKIWLWKDSSFRREEERLFHSPFNKLLTGLPLSKALYQSNCSHKTTPEHLHLCSTEVMSLTHSVESATLNKFPLHQHCKLLLRRSEQSASPDKAAPSWKWKIELPYLRKAKIKGHSSLSGKVLTLKALPLDWHGTAKVMELLIRCLHNYSIVINYIREPRPQRKGKANKEPNEAASVVGKNW